MTLSVAAASTASDLKNADFYVAAATVIPVIFVAVILDAGFRAWIAKKITTEKNTIKVIDKTLVAAWQLSAVLVLLVGAIGEVLALYALWQVHAGPIIGDIVFSSTVFLIILLCLSLAAGIPGLFLISLRELTLTVEDDENYLWSGVCLRLVSGGVPWRGGALFLTNKRLVWMTTRQMAFLAVPRIEIPAGKLKRSYVERESIKSALLRSLASHVLYLHRGYRLTISVADGNSHSFTICTSNDKFMEALQSLGPLQQPGTNGQGK